MGQSFLLWGEKMIQNQPKNLYPHFPKIKGGKKALMINLMDLCHDKSGSS